jgi:hypothetical protein
LPAKDAPIAGSDARDLVLGLQHRAAELPKVAAEGLQ